MMGDSLVTVSLPGRAYYVEYFIPREHIPAGLCPEIDCGVPLPVGQRAAVPFRVFGEVASQLLGYVASREAWRVPFQVSREAAHLVVWEVGAIYFTACVFRVVFLGGRRKRAFAGWC